MTRAGCRVRVPGAARGGRVQGATDGGNPCAPLHAASTGGHHSWYERGFTMIELLIVISIIVILASLGMVQYRNSVIRAREAVLKEDLFRMRDAIDQYYADKNKYPSSLDDLVSDGYLRELPVDPFTQSKDTWQTVNAEPNASDTTAIPGIYDVKSGATATALDGTIYSEWD
ncbi:MAG: prepilin-type N-terminal cleavage/methylation domain-containing protein [Vicinamibacterales bacterium]